MSKKHKFKKENENIKIESATQANLESEKSREKKEYNVKSDLVVLIVIMLFFTGALVGLYYYDKQSHILEAVTEQIMNKI